MAILTQNKLNLAKMNHNIVFFRKRHFCQKLAKIDENMYVVIITLTPGFRTGCFVIQSEVCMQTFCQQKPCHSIRPKFFVSPPKKNFFLSTQTKDCKGRISNSCSSAEILELILTRLRIRLNLRSYERNVIKLIRNRDRPFDQGCLIFSVQTFQIGKKHNK
jgi:hypothetical protein